MKKIFSIVTAVYNAVDKIEKTIQSVLEQEMQECEHVIVDGGSTDGTVETLKKYSEEYPDRVRYISEPDEGIYDAMNKGIKMARGEYLNFQGAGDSLVKGALEEVKKEVTYSVEIIYGMLYNEHSHKVTGKSYSRKRICKEPMPHPAMFYHYQVFKILGKYDQSYPIMADHLFNIKCFKNDEIGKRYLEKIIVNFEGTGISSWGVDIKGARELYTYISLELGEEDGCFYKTSGYELNQFLTFIDKAEVGVLSRDKKEKEGIIRKLQKYKDKIRILEDINILSIEYVKSKIKENEDLRIVITNNRDDITIEELVQQGLPIENILVYQEVIWDNLFIDFVRNIKYGIKVYIFGAGLGGEAVCDYLTRSMDKAYFNIKGILDNDKDRWGEYVQNYLIRGLEQIEIKEEDYFIIASDWYIVIKEQLMQQGVKKEQIIIAY